MSSKPPQSRVRWEKLRGTVSQSIRFNQYFFSNMKHTNPERDVLLLWAGEHIGGNCGSAASGGILWRSPERPSHARTKGAVLYVTKPVKIRRIKEPGSRQSHGAPTHPSPQSAETREADKVGHQLFILLWCTSTYQVWSRRYWFHLAEASTPLPLVFTGITAGRGSDASEPSHRLFRGTGRLHAYFTKVVQFWDSSLQLFFCDGRQRVTLRKTKRDCCSFLKINQHTDLLTVPPL